MKTREISVEARSAGPGGPAGETKSATLMVCEACDCEVFCVYAIGDHLHLQCADCGTSYCRGEGWGCGFALPPPKCRVCGCTDTSPCITAAGPCGWAEPDLCSACAERRIIVPSKKRGPNRPPSAQPLFKASRANPEAMNVPNPTQQTARVKVLCRPPRVRHSWQGMLDCRICGGVRRRATPVLRPRLL